MVSLPGARPDSLTGLSGKNARLEWAEERQGRLSAWTVLSFCYEEKWLRRWRRTCSLGEFS